MSSPAYELDSTRSDRASSATPGRVPPCDLIAEQNLLGAMMLSKDAISATAPMLRPDEF